MIDLKKVAKEVDLDYKVVCEVGVYLPKQSHVKNLVGDAERVIMIEATPEYANKLKEHFKKNKNVEVFNYAVYKENKKKVKMYNRQASTFIDGVVSPKTINKGYKGDDKHAFYVEAKTFDFFDEGDIDILTCDIEGAEWFVIQHLVSRPKIICLETHSELYDWQTYVNPFMEEIENWMEENNYEQHARDIGDTIYVRK